LFSSMTSTKYDHLCMCRINSAFCVFVLLGFLLDVASPFHLDAFQVLIVATHIKNGRQTRYSKRGNPRLSHSCSLTGVGVGVGIRVGVGVGVGVGVSVGLGAGVGVESRSRSSRSRSIEKLNALQVLDVATRCLTSAHCRHNHQSRSCEKLNALQVLTVATSINPGSGVGV
jgi:hypothetical protein